MFKNQPQLDSMRVLPAFQSKRWGFPPLLPRCQYLEVEPVVGIGYKSTKVKLLPMLITTGSHLTCNVCIIHNTCTYKHVIVCDVPAIT